MNTCESLLRVLDRFNVRHIFGVPGDSINELLEAMRKQEKIKFIHVMHEEAGAFAASAQAKLTGNLAVCTGTAGPGAIHLLNGLYDAKMDHAPVLAITGQVPTSLMGNEQHQEVDLVSLFRDVSVFNQVIIDPEQVPELVFRACITAMQKKGVAHLCIPRNISVQKIMADGYAQDVTVRSKQVPHENDLQHAIRLIEQSSKPCILAGIGAKDAVTELLVFSERIGAPIIKALRGKDLLPDTHPATLGGIGLLGTKPAYHAVKQCDLFIMAGTDFPYREFYPHEEVPVIQIEQETERIGRRRHVDCALGGDTKLALTRLTELLVGKRDHTFLHQCRKEMEKWLKEQEETELSKKTPIRPQTLARMISDQADDRAVICCDTGAVTVWGARNFRIKSRGQLFTLSGGLASMAFALPGAIGAQLSFPGRQVIALCGDGGFAMLMCDFATAVKYKLPVKVFIFNNGKLGLIQMEQEGAEGNPEYETDLHNPDYAAYAEICGGKGYTVKDPDLLEGVITEALASRQPCIVNVFVNPDELTMPPEITAEMAFNYVKAKTKEFLKG